MNRVTLDQIYRPSLALLTDLYQLTMAYGYWRLGKAERESVFHLFFRRAPFAGGYAIAAGLQPVADLISSYRFHDEDLSYLSGLEGNDGQSLFDEAFLRYLEHLRLSLDIDAIPEGTVVFPHEPLVRIRGPILQCQLLETPLLNLINFQTLIATKAARICDATRGEPVLEFGLRRAQGVDGALAASRAAFVGGCAATSNVLAGRLYGIPVKGTHAHSWVMSFDDELAAFDAYADAMPNNCVFLVDTYDTLTGVQHAIQVGRQLRERGHEMIGIRLDSGDLAYLSIEARRHLDEAGFPDATIVASNDLDERLVASLKSQGAKISVWGIGTKLVTGDSQPALGGVYKLAAIRDEQGAWQPRVKLSEQIMKTSIPGMLQVRRLYNEDGQAVADMIHNLLEPVGEKPVMIDPADPTRHRSANEERCEELLAPIFRSGQQVWQSPTLAAIQTRTNEQLGAFHHSLKRFENPHRYPVGLEANLYDLKTRLVREHREQVGSSRQR